MILGYSLFSAQFSETLHFFAVVFAVKDRAEKSDQRHHINPFFAIAGDVNHGLIPCFGIKASHQDFVNLPGSVPV